MVNQVVINRNWDEVQKAVRGYNFPQGYRVEPSSELPAEKSLVTSLQVYGGTWQGLMPILAFNAVGNPLGSKVNCNYGNDPEGLGPCARLLRKLDVRVSVKLG